MRRECWKLSSPCCLHRVHGLGDTSIKQDSKDLWGWRQASGHPLDP